MSKIAIITGGNRGLGRSMALHLARKGVDSIITYRSGSEQALAVVAEISQLGAKAVALQLDVGDSSSFAGFVSSVQQALQQWERRDFDFLVNNAGIGTHQLITETTEHQFDSLMNIHFKGVFFLTQKLLPLMRDGGHILNISSGLTRFTMPGYAAYAAMKGGIETLSRYLAKELGPRGIRVNVLAPGAIETDFGGGAVRDNADINRFVADQTALGRVGLPDDIGALVALLLSEDSGWVTGQRIEASGGMFL